MQYILNSILSSLKTMYICNDDVKQWEQNRLYGFRLGIADFRMFFINFDDVLYFFYIIRIHQHVKFHDVWIFIVSLGQKLFFYHSNVKYYDIPFYRG